MKIGVLQFFSWPGRRGDLKDVYDRAVERVRIMDQNGYDAVWIAEHHFSTYSVCPSINMMGMHFANQTKNLRIGTGVSLAAFYDPLRLAEEVALLDVLSGGRVTWGCPLYHSDAADDLPPGDHCCPRLCTQRRVDHSHQHQ